MMGSESWSRVSLRIASDTLTAAEISKVMGLESLAPQGKSWATDITTDSGAALDDQLEIVKDFLRGKAAVLESLDDCIVSLCIGWTPRTPQDGIAIDVELIQLLSRIGCHVLLDTYSDS
jgi:hypothetical protein